MGQVLSQTLRTMTGLSRNIQMCIFIIFRPHKWGRKIMIRDGFFFTNLANSTLSPLHLSSIMVAQSGCALSSIMVAQSGCRSWVRTRAGA